MTEPASFEAGQHLQQDIYQRYSFFGQLLLALTGSAASRPFDRPLRVLDVGCGPDRLTEIFLDPTFVVIRADVERFDQDDMVLLEPGRPLPFDDRSFDVVIALDVLEHVAAGAREGLVRELQRVAARVVVISHPIDRPEVIHAELEFARWAHTITGRGVAFLQEHADLGLPNPSQVANWLAEKSHVLVTETAPLAEWLFFNIVDYVYAFEFGDGDEKHAFNAAINAVTPLVGRNIPHYRAFVCAFSESDDVTTAKTYVDSVRRDAHSLLAFAAASGEALAHLHRDLRNQLIRLVSPNTQPVTEASPLLGYVHALLASLSDKDRHTAELLASLSDKDRHTAELLASLSDKDGQIEALAQLRVRDQENAAATRKAMENSRSWRVTAPLRALAATGRRLAKGTSPSVKQETAGAAEPFGTSKFLRDRAKSVTRVRVRRFLQTRSGRSFRAKLSPYLRTRVGQAAKRRLSSLVGASSPIAETPIQHWVGGPSSTFPRDVGYVPPVGLLPWFNPLNAVVSAKNAQAARLNIILPHVGMASTSGGPNTAIILGCKLASTGIPVRLVSADVPLDADLRALHKHVQNLTGQPLPSNIELLDAHDRRRPVEFGPNDAFLATAWWTAQQTKYVVRLTNRSQFLYLIQDFEPLLHAASSSQALAIETYSLDCLPLVNSRLLYDYFVSEKIGRFADQAFSDSALVFDPALDRHLFRPRETRSVEGRRRLLFYTRPQIALRNLFELGVAALQKAVRDGVFSADNWEFWGIGETFSSITLGDGARLVPAPWLDLPGYAKQMRDSDIVLSLMLSPHPSYPPLEMAASGGFAVTTCFGTKTAEELARLSSNIIGVPATIEGISQGLASAVGGLSDWDRRLQGSRIELPHNWDESLNPLMPRLVEALADLQGGQRSPGTLTLKPSGASRDPFESTRISDADYADFRREARRRRRSWYPDRGECGLISFLTPVWNTNPTFLEELADSVLNQDSGMTFEWIVLDNGSDSAGTRQALQRLDGSKGVRFYRVGKNLGNVGGLRYCLERASNRYIAALDHDDLVSADCVRVVSHALHEAQYPVIAYTDEDMISEEGFTLPYLKPDWDPVLFANSCYTSHLGIIDRLEALRLGAYTDGAVEGSPDWDLFTRFVVAGHAPHHIPEVLYSWRRHSGSTSINILSKPFVYQSQHSVLKRLVEGLSPSRRYTIDPSPLFQGTPDWRIRRDSAAARPVTTVVLTEGGGPCPSIPTHSSVPHEVVQLDAAGGIAALGNIVQRVAESGRLLHIVWAGTRIEGEDWPLEAMTMFDLFPDSAIVGGRLHRNRRVVHGGCYFGFGRGCDSSDYGRSIDDSGYFVQAWKPHSVSAVLIDHCVMDAAFIAAVLKSLPDGALGLPYLGAWLGAASRRHNRRVIYDPLLSAETDLDLSERVTNAEREAFRRIHYDLIPEDRFLSPHLGLSPATAFRPVTPESRRCARTAPRPLAYAEDLATDVIVRKIRYATASDTPRFSLLTSVYARTPAGHFRSVVESVLAQTRSQFEWILLANGPVSEGVQQILDEATRDCRIRRIASAANIGIVGAIRSCFEHASGDYVIPVDADDLLERDALAVFASAIRETQPDFAFSDEDHISGYVRQAAFRRHGFDPVLNMENSYVWHLCAFRRDRAQELGAYSDDGAEYCHDWDTLTRFAAAGARIAHVPHLLYHWRTHESSQSNRGERNPGSLASTRHILERTLSQLTPDRYAVEEFPIFRGAPEWWIRRLPGGEPAVAVVFTGSTSSSATTKLSLGRVQTITRHLTHEVSTLDEWRAFAGAIPPDTELVVVLDERYRPVGHDWLEEALKWLELMQDVVVVGGRVVDAEDIVVDAGLMRNGRGFKPVYRGGRRDSPGPFALALKSQTIAAPAESFFVANAQFLRDCAESVITDGCRAPFGVVLAETADLQEKRIVYAPLVEARAIR